LRATCALQTGNVFHTHVCALRSTPVRAKRSSPGRAAPPRSVYLSGGLIPAIKIELLLTACRGGSHPHRNVQSSYL